MNELMSCLCQEILFHILAFVILPLTFLHQHVRERAGVSADRHGSVRESRQENDKNQYIQCTLFIVAQTMVMLKEKEAVEIVAVWDGQH